MTNRFFRAPFVWRTLFAALCLGYVPQARGSAHNRVAKVLEKLPVADRGGHGRWIISRQSCKSGNPVSNSRQFFRQDYGIYRVNKIGTENRNCSFRKHALGQAIFEVV